jgi:hypothetical protein
MAVYGQLERPYPINKGVGTRGSERYSHDWRRCDTLSDGGKMPLSGDIFVLRRNASLGHLFIQVCRFNTCVQRPESPLRYGLVILDACVERYLLNRAKCEGGALSLSLKTVCFVQKKDESINRAHEATNESTAN